MVVRQSSVTCDATAEASTIDSMSESRSHGRSAFRQAVTILSKDLKIEIRSREIVYTMAFFASMIVLLFSFAFKDSNAEASVVISGLIWISVIFSGTLGLSRAFDREREGDTMRGLLLAPIPRSAIFVGKAASIAIYMLVVEAVVVPLTAFLFSAALFEQPLELAATLLLATIGFSVIGSVFSAMLLRTRSRDVLLPVILYPILVPLFMAATFSTMAILPPEINVATSHFWIKFLCVYDAVFITASLWIFESLVIE